jgi:hypothetical protein
MANTVPAFSDINVSGIEKESTRNSRGPRKKPTCFDRSISVITSKYYAAIKRVGCMPYYK